MPSRLLPFLNLLDSVKEFGANECEYVQRQIEKSADRDTTSRFRELVGLRAVAGTKKLLLFFSFFAKVCSSARSTENREQERFRELEFNTNSTTLAKGINYLPCG